MYDPITEIGGPAGPLEVRLEVPGEDAPAPPPGGPRAAAIFHPHPQHGGTMQNKVVYQLARACVESGVPALRVNFRGVGRSAGTYAHGAGEREDARAAVDFLAERYPEGPLLAAGFSFGARFGLAGAAPHPRVRWLIAAGLPLALFDGGYLIDAPQAKLLVSGTNDEFATPEALRALFERLRPPRALVLVEGADHFFTGMLDPLRETVQTYVKLAATAPPEGVITLKPRPAKPRPRD